KDISSGFVACCGSLGVRRSIGQSKLRANHDRARRVGDRSGHTPRSRQLPHGSRRIDTRQSKETRHSNHYSLGHHVLPPWWLSPSPLNLVPEPKEPQHRNGSVAPLSNPATNSKRRQHSEFMRWKCQLRGVPMNKELIH